MGFITEITAVEQNERNGVEFRQLKVNAEATWALTVEQFSSAGDDSPPMTGDYAATTSLTRKGGQAAVGYIDPKLTPVSNPGEKRVYSRDANGAEVAQLYLKNDGSVQLSNSAGSFQLLSNGNLNLNGVIIDPSGTITLPNGIVLNTHTHPFTGVGAGNPGVTNPPLV